MAGLLMCWQDCWCYDAPSSLHVPVCDRCVTQTETLINVKVLDSGKKPAATTRSHLVRPGASRPQLRSKSNLIPGRSLFLARCSSGMATQQPGTVLFLIYFPTPSLANIFLKKIENLHIFVKALPFSPFTVRMSLRSESS